MAARFGLTPLKLSIEKRKKGFCGRHLHLLLSSNLAPTAQHKILLNDYKASKEKERFAGVLHAYLKEIGKSSVLFYSG